MGELECPGCQGISFIPVIEHDVPWGKQTVLECTSCRIWIIHDIEYRKGDPNQTKLEKVGENHYRMEITSEGKT